MCRGRSAPFVNVQVGGARSYYSPPPVAFYAPPSMPLYAPPAATFAPSYAPPTVSVDAHIRLSGDGRVWLTINGQTFVSTLAPAVNYGDGGRVAYGASGPWSMPPRR